MSLLKESDVKSFEYMDFYRFQEQVMAWAKDRNLIKGSTPKDQFHKLIQECAELSDSICKGNDVRDDIGDILVVLTIISRQMGVYLDECMYQAWNDIKDRKGKMVDGIFIKEQDL